MVRYFRTLSLKYRHAPIALVLLVLLLWRPLPAQAATIRVDATCTLLQAFNSAFQNATPSGSSCEAGDASGPTAEDVIVLTADVALTAEVSPRLGGALTGAIRESVRLEGNGHSISGAGNHRLLGFSDEIRLTFNNVVLRNGGAGPGALLRVRRVDTHINNSVFENSSSAGDGGAIIAGSAANLYIANSVFRNNSGELGGAIYSTSAAAHRIRGSVFIGNSASNVGGAIVMDGTSGTLVIDDSSFFNNSATNFGGALLALNASITVRNSTFSGNSAAYAAVGTISASTDDHRLRFQHVTAVGNSVTAADAGIVQRFKTTPHNTNAFQRLDIWNSVIADNSGLACLATSLASETLGEALAFMVDTTGSYIEDGNCRESVNLANNGPPFLGPRRTTSRGHVYYEPQLRGTVEETDPDTLALVTRTVLSPLVDMANSSHCLGRDQLGRGRPSGPGCDMGAIEYQYPVAARASGRGGGAPRAPSGPSCEWRVQTGVSVSGAVSGAQCQAVNAAGVGNQQVVAAGFLAAVDLWGYLGPGLDVCFDQRGAFVFLDAATSPRTLYRLGGYEGTAGSCARVERAGTLVLVPADSALLSAGLPSLRPGEPAPRALDGCALTTQTLLNLRAGPGLEHPVLGLVASGALVWAEARTDTWFRVTVAGMTGWVSAHYVVTAGVCA